MYDLEVKIVLSTGETIDVSPAIRHFTFVQSFKTRFPMYRLLISNQFIKFINSKFEYFYINVYNKQEDNTDFESYVFYARPITSAFQILSTSFEKEEPYRDYIWIDLADYTLHNILSKLHNAKIYRHITLGNILKQYIDNLQIDEDTFNQETYDEIFIPTMSLDSMIDFLDYHFGYYKTNHVILYRWLPKDIDYSIVIQDNTKLDKYDYILYKIDRNTDVNEIIKEEAENIDKLITVSAPLIFENELPERITFNKLDIIDHPLDKLYNYKSYDIKQYIDEYCPTSSPINLEESNVTNIPDNIYKVYTHNRESSVTSLLSNDFYTATCQFTLENPKVRLLSGHKVSVKSDNPDIQKHLGKYICEVSKYDFTYQNANWQCIANFILTRTNPYEEV